MRKKLLFMVVCGLSCGLLLASYFYHSRSGGTVLSSTNELPSPVSAFKVENVTLNEVATHNQQRIQSAYQLFLSQSAPVSAGVTEFELKYVVKRPNKPDVPASAQIFVPLELAEGPNLLMIYGPGTTGLDDRCAPSTENPFNPTLGNYENQMLTYAAQGITVIMPDYLGFDTQHQLQYYFIAEEEAYSMLSAVLAFFETRPEARQNVSIFLAGYSQGGHSAFAAADYAQQLTPELKIAGVVGHGPTTNVENLLHSNPNLAPYVISAYDDFYPQLEPEKIINAQRLASLNSAEKICADEGFGYDSVALSQMYTSDFFQALEAHQVAERFPQEYSLFSSNNAGRSFSKYPVFLAQGTNDPIVTKDDQDGFVSDLCRRAVPVTYYLYEGLHHFFIRQRSFVDTHTWMKQVAQGAHSSECTTQVHT
ncbi:MAG TPA: lipase family protein [Vitreimonas sp.]|nr:lipase family protein [Vitreimonas sp.]